MHLKKFIVWFCRFERYLLFHTSEHIWSVLLEWPLYEYICLQNGLTTAPRIFTKILKVPFSHRRKREHTNVAYIDDSLLISKSYSECSVNISETVSLLDSLGFTIHPTKSVMQHTQIIIFFGLFWIGEVWSIIPHWKPVGFGHVKRTNYI